MFDVHNCLYSFFDESTAFVYIYLQNVSQHDIFLTMDIKSFEVISQEAPERIFKQVCACALRVQCTCVDVYFTVTGSTGSNKTV